MKKIILIVVGVIVVAILGRLGWAYYQIRETFTPANIDIGGGAENPARFSVNGIEAETITTTSLSVPSTKETEIQRDINVILADTSNCEKTYGKLSVCSKDNDVLIEVIRECLKYIGDTAKAKECVLTQSNMIPSGIQSFSFGTGEPTVINGVTQLSTLWPVDETSAGFTLSCFDKNTPKDNHGNVDMAQARKVITTNDSVDEVCSGSINLGVMCSNIDISPYEKCSQAVTKYGPYKRSKEVVALVDKYMKMLGLR